MHAKKEKRDEYKINTTAIIRTHFEIFNIELK